MCLYGTYEMVKVINPNQAKKSVPIDACIADEIRRLNMGGIVTLGCCCGHGTAGQIMHWENGFGKWRGHREPPHALIDKNSIGLANDMGYRPFPYYYADGSHEGVWQVYLKTGCMTHEDCQRWHVAHDVPFVDNVGEIQI